jgi:predicted SAM-dependent methyltransferase
MKNLLHPRVLNKFSKLSSSLRFGRVKRRLKHFDKLHLASGKKILEGWGNIDFVGGGEVIGWNLTNDFPVNSNSVNYIFCEHFIEHITRKEALKFLSECARVLKSGGVLRVTTPNLEKLIQEYSLQRTTEWANVGWLPDTPCQMANEFFRSWEHKFSYDQQELSAILRQVGFGKVTPAAWRESDISELRGLEFRPYHEEVILEGIKL